MGNNTLIGMAGDWHGHTLWAEHALDLFADKGINRIFQMGDFGVWPGEDGKYFLDRLNKTLTVNDQTVEVSPGNHEDYTQLEAVPVAEDGYQYVRDRIKVMPRGFRGMVGDKSFVSLGGGNSIDRFSRVPNVSWWAQESITMGDVYRTIDGGHADIMFAHDVAAGVPLPDNHRTDAKWALEALAYAQESRNMMLGAVHGVKPSLFVHGHYHTFNDVTVTLNDGEVDYQTRFVCLDKNDSTSRKANAVFDVEVMEFVEFF